MIWKVSALEIKAGYSSNLKLENSSNEKSFELPSVKSIGISVSSKLTYTKSLILPGGASQVTRKFLSLLFF